MQRQLNNNPAIGEPILHSCYKSATLLLQICYKSATLLLHFVATCSKVNSLIISVLRLKIAILLHLLQGGVKL